MPALLVTYDLHDEASRPKIVDAIRAIGSCIRLSESSYAVSTFLTPTQVYTRLKPLLDRNDNLYVIALRRPIDGAGPAGVNKWLSVHLTF